jgi:hypothetical protein
MLRRSSPPRSPHRCLPAADLARWVHRQHPRGGTALPLRHELDFDPDFDFDFDFDPDFDPKGS